MKLHFGDAMQDFLDDHRHFPGGTPGNGAFTGKELRKIMEPDSLRKLSEYLPSTGEPWLRYLSAVRALYGCCVKQHLDEDFSYEDKVDTFRRAFEEVHLQFGLSETLKVGWLFRTILYDQQLYLKYTCCRCTYSPII